VTAAAAATTTTTTTTTSNNDDNHDEEEASVSTYSCRVYFESEKAGSKDLHVLFAMAEGQDNGLNFPKHTDPPFIESKIYAKQMKPNRQILQAEVKRRFNAYILQGKEPKPSAWTIAVYARNLGS
jgi:hypothetical protein